MFNRAFKKIIESLSSYIEEVFSTFKMDILNLCFIDNILLMIVFSVYNVVNDFILFREIF
jgi:hypothetical protein